MKDIGTPIYTRTFVFNWENESTRIIAPTLGLELWTEYPSITKVGASTFSWEEILKEYNEAHDDKKTLEEIMGVRNLKIFKMNGPAGRGDSSQIIYSRLGNKYDEERIARLMIKEPKRIEQANYTVRNALKLNDPFKVGRYLGDITILMGKRFSARTSSLVYEDSALSKINELLTKRQTKLN